MSAWPWLSLSAAATASLALRELAVSDVAPSNSVIIPAPAAGFATALTSLLTDTGDDPLATPVLTPLASALFDGAATIGGGTEEADGSRDSAPAAVRIPTLLTLKN
jgi:hypothetical protein